MENGPAGKRLLYDQGVGVEPLHRVVPIPENDVAKLVMFLQACGESWKFDRRPEIAASTVER